MALEERAFQIKHAVSNFVPTPKLFGISLERCLLVSDVLAGSKSAGKYHCKPSGTKNLTCSQLSNSEFPKEFNELSNHYSETFSQNDEEDLCHITDKINFRFC